MGTSVRISEATECIMHKFCEKSNKMVESKSNTLGSKYGIVSNTPFLLFYIRARLINQRDRYSLSSREPWQVDISTIKCSTQCVSTQCIYVKKSTIERYIFIRFFEVSNVDIHISLNNPVSVGLYCILSFTVCALVLLPISIQGSSSLQRPRRS